MSISKRILFLLLTIWHMKLTTAIPVNRINVKLPFQNGEISIVDSSKPSDDQAKSYDVALPFNKLHFDQFPSESLESARLLNEIYMRRIKNNKRQCRTNYLRSAPTAEGNFIRTNKPKLEQRGSNSKWLPKYLQQKLDIIQSKEDVESLRSPSPTGNLPPLQTKGKNFLSDYAINGNIKSLNKTDSTKTKGVQWLPFANQWSLNPSIFDSPLSMIDMPLSKLSLPLGRLNTPPEPNHAYLSNNPILSPLDQPTNTIGKYIPAKMRRKSSRKRRHIPTRGPNPVYVPPEFTRSLGYTPINQEEIVEKLALGGIPYNQLPDYIKKRCKSLDLICQASAALTPDVGDGIDINQFSLPYSFLNLPFSFFNLPLAYLQLPFGSFNLPFGYMSVPFAYNNMPFQQMTQMFQQLYIDSLYLTSTSFVREYGPETTEEMLTQVQQKAYDENIDCSEFEFDLQEFNITESIDQEVLNEMDVGSNETAAESIQTWIDLIGNTSKRFNESIVAGNLTRIQKPRDALSLVNDIIGKFGMPKEKSEKDTPINEHLKMNEDIIQVLRAAIPSVPDYAGLWGSAYSLYTTPFSLFNLPFGFMDEPLAFVNLPFAHFALPLAHLPMPFAELVLPMSVVREPYFPKVENPYDSFVVLSDVPPSLLELVKPIDPLVSYMNSPFSEMNLPLAVMDLPFTVFDMPFAFMNMPYSHMNQPFTHLHFPFEVSSLPLAEMAEPFTFLRSFADIE